MQCEGGASSTGPRRLVVHTSWVQELESPSSLGDQWSQYSSATPSLGEASPTHPACSPISRGGPGEPSGSLLSAETDVGFKRSELKPSVSAFPQFSTTPPAPGRPHQHCARHGVVQTAYPHPAEGHLS